MKWYIGTAGWSYDTWRGLFYPEDLPKKEWLDFYAHQFDAVEINNTFYRIPKPSMVETWERSVPESFTFSFKASRLVTHRKRLKEPDEMIPLVMKPLLVRKNKGPILFQLPPRFPKNVERLKLFLDRLPGQQRYTFEFRDPSWHAPDIYDLLSSHNVAFCLFEKVDYFSPRIVTADFTYTRLHGREEGYSGSYILPVLENWHQWLRAQDKDAYVFFDNTDEKVYALENAKTFKKLSEIL